MDENITTLTTPTPLTNRQSVNYRLDKEVAQNILMPLKKEWKCRNISEVIEKLYLEYKYSKRSK